MSQEEKNLLIERYVRSREKNLINSYIADGPTELRNRLGLNEQQWEIVFDYLVFNFDLLIKCINGNGDFFLNTYVKYGMDHVRDLLNISSDKYDHISQKLFHIIAIEQDGLYYHVLENRTKYHCVFRSRGSEFLRTKLLINTGVHDDYWRKILSLFLSDYCNDLLTEKKLEQSLYAFTQVMNGLRVHRPIEKSEIIMKSQV